MSSLFSAQEYGCNPLGGGVKMWKMTVPERSRPARLVWIVRSWFDPESWRGAGFLLAACLFLRATGLVRAEPPASVTRDYQVKTWDTDDGLPDPIITRIAQTQDGFLWIGGFGGLTRFDGV